MCGIENMYLCNCIVRLMANSVLEEKIFLTCLFMASFFKRRMYILGFCLAAGRGRMMEQHLNEQMIPF